MNIAKIRKADRHPIIGRLLKFIDALPENEIKTKEEIIDAGLMGHATVTRCFKDPRLAPYVYMVPRARLEGISGYVVGKPKAIAAVKKLVEDS